MPKTEINDKVKNSEATLRIPFASKRHAEIAYRVLTVDKEPRRNFVEKELKLLDDCVEVRFVADQAKNLRNAISSFFECLLLCQETIRTFDLETNNAGTHTSPNST